MTFFLPYDIGKPLEVVSNIVTQGVGEHELEREKSYRIIKGGHNSSLCAIHIM
jgi:hypothetical protein